MVGGGGERKTLRLVAQYGDATNVFGGPVQIAHKYEVLREHCEAVGRPYDEIERSTLQTVRLGDGSGRTESPDQIVERFGELADAGAQHVIFSVPGVGVDSSSSGSSSPICVTSERGATEALAAGDDLDCSKGRSTSFR
jgi:alkanesulfonate monooxygenase SsuD/methylene tetrahydromethanopterin reductase-like flavin-dependent oxidoreductase (luciferase family)